MFNVSTISISRMLGLGFVLAALMLSTVIAVAIVAPTDVGMGIAQRVLYVHVSVAWFGLASMLLMGASSILYLRNRDLRWDGWARAATEIGWLTCSLTLVTGSLWAHAAWATWWTWDPRLLTSFVLWLIFTGCLLVRALISDEHRGARAGVVFASIGLLDVPLVVMATRWFRGIHPVSPEMESSMYFVLAWSLLSFTIFFGLLLLMRGRQFQLEHQLKALQQSPCGWDLRVADPNHRQKQESSHDNVRDYVFNRLAGAGLVRRAFGSSPTQAESDRQCVDGADRGVGAHASAALISRAVSLSRRQPVTPFADVHETK